MNCIPVVLSGPPKCRIWLAGVPQEYASRGTVEELKFDTIGAHQHEKPVSVALEVYKSAGPRVIFGMLGGSYQPDPGCGSLKILVALSPDTSSRLTGTLAGILDDVHAGIPEWVAKAIAQGAETAARQNNMSGVVNLSYGAFGESSSSIVVFAYLTHVLFALMEKASSAAELSRDELERIISSLQL